MWWGMSSETIICRVLAEKKVDKHFNKKYGVFVDFLRIKTTTEKTGYLDIYNVSLLYIRTH